MNKPLEFLRDNESIRTISGDYKARTHVIVQNFNDTMCGVVVAAVAVSQNDL